MQFIKGHHFLAVFFSVALHVLAFSVVSNNTATPTDKLRAPEFEKKIVFLEVLPPPPDKKNPPPTSQTIVAKKVFSAAPASQVPPESPAVALTPERQLAAQAAPPAPTAQEWAFAAKYTLKNSKGYRYTWGQQVRSTMGTALEGADQGVVRFRVEIAPDGTLAKLETLWTTSAEAERLARRAIENMPSSPPTPTGKPLVFERTISFSPFASDGPPTFKDDCLPDLPAFRNPFAWDGKSPKVQVEATTAKKPDPQALEKCLKELPQDTIDAESAQDKRLLDQWGSSKSGR